MASRADEQNLNPPVAGEEPDYEQLIDDYTHFAPPHEGELLQGRVVKLHDKDVIVDFGYKSEGLVPIEQFRRPDGRIHGPSGRRGRRHDRSPASSRKATSCSRTRRPPPARLGQPGEGVSATDLVISGRVMGRVKGGLSVDVGFKAFMPGSQVDPRPVAQSRFASSARIFRSRSSS